jgi:type II secretory ATPase GspE/PulE/Tfp pilus assembly ATPase PilB-like protein
MGGKDSVIERLLGSAEKFSDEQVAHTVDLLVEHAIARQASDVHIEPSPRFALVRYRIDGDLRGVHKLPLTALEALTARLKTLAHLQTYETRTPQEGHYTTTVDEQTFTIRVTTLPVVGGEKLVLHLTAQQHEPHALEALGLWGDGLQRVRSALAQPHGLLLVAGPKRSGKSNTLYSLLNVLHTPAVNVATVEDPVKHHITGVNQLQVHARAGISFVEGLQAVLRQDANIVMVSDIVDQQTGDLAIHAANTGHCVLAGVHADSAARGLLQLRSMAVQPFLLASGLRLSIAQRLVRKLCRECREHVALDDHQRMQLEKHFHITPALRRRVHELETQASKAGIGAKLPLQSTINGVTHVWQASKEGCKACHYTGFSGQIALFEVILVSDHIRNLLLGRPTIAAVEVAAFAEGFVPLQLDGLIKALRGETDLQDVLRAAPSSYALPSPA